MRLSINLLPGKRKYLYGSILFILISLVGLAFSLTGPDDFELARREILLRRIGHEILLQSGDSTSRVLPVKRMAENTFQLSFENPFRFQPESLVHTTQRFLSQDPALREYVVKVVNPADGRVTYGYAISGQQKDDIITCIGRKQPLASYLVEITFKPTAIITAREGYLLAGLFFLTGMGFLFVRSAKPRKDRPERQQADMLPLGAMRFDPESRQLLFDGQTTDLTRTEARVLHIFALSPNETIERSRLQKEIWEDEGVIVGRSLDMFISKLRKKLEADPALRIVVIRGKGYKLEIGT